jgi:DNA-binding NarL/FixJ family response regulator
VSSPSLVIVDDHSAVRDALAQLLRSHGVRVIGVASSAESGYELALRRRPDAAIVDIRLAGDSGLGLTRRLLESLPDLAVLLYTGEPIDPSRVQTLLDTGARGVALKTGDAQELVDAIARVTSGRRYVDPRLRSTAHASEHSALSELTDREREILRLVGEGVSTTAIAQRLFLSPHTVRTHVRNSLRKLGVSTRAQAVLMLERAESPLDAIAAHDPGD